MADNGARQLAPAQGNKPSRGLLDLLESDRVRKGLAAVAGKHMNPERLTKLVISAINRTPMLLRCDPKTVLGAVMTTTALGLEPNTPQQHAWLLPYKTRRKVGDNEWEDYCECQFQIGAQGWLVLMYRNPVIKRINAGAIYERDHFVYKDAAEIVFEYTPALFEEDRGRIVGAYAYAKVILDSGVEDLIPTVMPWGQIVKVRDRSETYRALARKVADARSLLEKGKAEAKLAETPWVLWEDQMVEKTMIKRLRKRIPITPQIAAAAAVDDGADTGSIDFAQMADPDFTRAVMDGEEGPPVLEHQDEDALDTSVRDTHEQRPTVVVSNPTRPPAETAASRAGHGADDRIPDPPDDEQRPPAAKTAAPKPAAKGGFSFDE